MENKESQVKPDEKNIKLPVYRTSIRSLWEWFPSSLHRLYHIRLLSAIIICLPAVLLITWYSFSAFSSHIRYNSAINSNRPLSLELFHIHLYDTITRHIRSFLISSPPKKKRISVYNLLVDRGEFSNIYDQFLNDRKRPYIIGRMESKGKSVDVEFRYRGTKHWHWNYSQKSLKFRLREKGLFEETRRFNIINEVTPLGIGEKIIMDMSKELDILTPKYKPVRFKINSKHMGLYFFLAQPDEFLLRKSQRIPGSIFSGNEAPADKKTGLSLLFKDAKYWKKTATAKASSSKDMMQLKKLLDKINNADFNDFADFVKYEIDTIRFARYEALDIIFGSDQHDFNQNHKIYFDHYKGRFEPIAWNFRGWKHRRRFNLEQNPLRIRLDLIPEYVALRNRIIYNLLLKKSSIGSLQKRIKKILKLIAAELRSDPFWDAYNLLPDFDPYLRRMVRPMNKGHQVLSIKSTLKTMSQRRSYLLERLERTGFTLRTGELSQTVLPVLLEITDLAGYELKEILIEMDDNTTPVSVYTDNNLDAEVTPLTDNMIGIITHNKWTPIAPIQIYPGAITFLRNRKAVKNGNIRVKSSPGHYLFFLKGLKNKPKSIIFRGRNLLTDSLTSSITGLPFIKIPIIKKGGGKGFGPGLSNLHPWLNKVQKPERVSLGPGNVFFKKTIIFPSYKKIIILPGTHIQMGEEASIIFLGKVEIRGTRQAPVRITGEPGTKNWGGIAIHGSATMGSIIKNFQIAGGTSPKWRMVKFPGVFNIHDTSNIVVEGLSMSEQTNGIDQLHIAYVDKWILESCNFKKSSSDAIDIEFSNGIIRSCRINGTTEDGIDMMGSKVSIQDCILYNCSDNGISAGQRSNVEIRNSLIAGSNVGGLSKSSSTLRISGSLFVKNNIALKVETREILYAGLANIESDQIFSIDNNIDIDISKEKKTDIIRVIRKYPVDESLSHLLLNVIGEKDWAGFKKKLKKLLKTI